jgi:hypothetical protein
VVKKLLLILISRPKINKPTYNKPNASALLNKAHSGKISGKN